MTDNTISRREFIKRAGVGAAGLALTSFGVLPSEAADERPNIIFAIADDWMFPHAGAYGDKVVKTPTFDRVASEGVLFNNSFCAAPTCTASRAGILTGQAIHRLEEGGNLNGFLPSRFAVYPDLLETAGYFVGTTGKAWAPGTLEGSGRTRNPAGPGFRDFKTFMEQAPKDKPFCFWFGSTNPHRPYTKGKGLEAGMKPEDVEVPAFLPDTQEVREDILDYYEEVQQFDAQVAEVLKVLEASGKAQNTIVVITSDNGMPFPRAKANLYEAGTHMPLAIRWPAKIKGGRKVDDLVSHTDFAPTFLELAGLKPKPDMTGMSLAGVLLQDKPLGREAVFTERERHARVRENNVGYPCRAVRTKDFLYIRNFFPERWPAGDPNETGGFGDIDGSPTKDLLLKKRDDKKIAPFFKRACEKRPEEELFDLREDPWAVHSVANVPEYADIRKQMRAMLDKWMKGTADPRAANPRDERWDKFEYFGKKAAPTPAKK